MKDARFGVRRRKLSRLLKQDGLNALLVTDPLNVFYLTGFTGGDSWFFHSKEHSVLISDPRYALQIAEEAPGVEVLIRRSGVTLVSAAQELLNSSGNVGIEADSTSTADFLSLSAHCRGELRPVSQLVESLREIKDSREVAAIREAVRIASVGFDVLRLTLNPDMTEAEARNELEYQMRRVGADEPAFPTIAAVGARSALPHAVPTEKNHIADGGLFLVDWGAKKNMYLSDLTRVLITAKHPTSLMKKVYNLVLQAQRAALDLLRPGITGAEADCAARAVIERGGYAGAFNHGLGHGIGTFVHERGGLSRGARQVLKPGMVVTVEPGIYLPGRFGVRIEDDVLITPDGIEVLSEGLRKEFDEMLV